MVDYNRLYRSLFKIKQFLIEHNESKFVSFDLTDNPNQIQGNSFKIHVNNGEEVMYFLKFYKLNENISEMDIEDIKSERGYTDVVYLILQLEKAE